MVAVLVTCCKIVYMDMNKATLHLVGIVSLTLSLLTHTARAAEPVRMDSIAAVINDDVIMLSEATARARVLSSSGKLAGASPQALLKKAVDDLILERLQIQEAKKEGITIDDVTLNKTIEGIARQNNLNLPQFQQALQQEGLNYAEFREQTRRKLMADALRQRQVRGRVKVSDQEIEDLIASQSHDLTRGERYNLQHILIAAPNGIPVNQANAARQQAEKLRQRIVSGEDFTQLARNESDSHAAKQGGNLGWQESDKLPPSFKRTLTLMQTGEVSEVIRDPQGFHILKLLDRQGGKRQLTNATRTRHILVSTEKHPEAQAKQKIDGIFQQLQSGADFAALAKQHSDDPGSGKKGGDLGWIVPGQTVAPFEQTMNRAALNTISPPFKSRFGWHILQVLERKQQDSTENALRNRANQYLGERKSEERYQAWLQGLRNEAYIEYRIPTDKKLQLR